jgi:hypothetical protein
MNNLLGKLETLGKVLTIAGLIAAPPTGDFKDFKPINYIGAGAMFLGLSGVISARRLQGQNLLGNYREDNNYGTNEGEYKE